jgi:hypothetical protein
MYLLPGLTDLPRNRRIVHLNTVASGGSIPSLIRSLNYGASEYDFDVEFIFGRGKAPSDLRTHRVGGLHTQACDLFLSRLFDGAGRYSGVASGEELPPAPYSIGFGKIHRTLSISTTFMVIGSIKRDCCSVYPSSRSRLSGHCMTIGQ